MKLFAAVGVDKKIPLAGPFVGGPQERFENIAVLGKKMSEILELQGFFKLEAVGRFRQGACPPQEVAKLEELAEVVSLEGVLKRDEFLKAVGFPGGAAANDVVVAIKGNEEVLDLESAPSLELFEEAIGIPVGCKAALAVFCCEIINESIGIH